MKKITLLVLAMCALLSGCTPVMKESTEKINVVCTTFPQYDWTREVIKGKEDRISLTLLSRGGADMHSYNPSADDLIAIYNSDLFIYTGGDSEKWVTDAIKDKGAIKTLNMMRLLGDDVLKKENANIIADGHDHYGDLSGADEHIWLSLDNAEEITEEIARALGEIDRENKDVYHRNAQRYKSELEILDDKYERTVERSSYKTLLFADRFPFLYLTDDYDIKVYAAFPGCTTESEASFETIAFLSDKLKNERLSSVVIIDGSGDELARTIIENSGKKDCKIVTLNSMQTIGEKEISEGVTYLSLMEDNLSAISEALN